MNTAVVMKTAKVAAPIAEPVRVSSSGMNQVEAYLSYSIHAMASINDDSVSGEALRGLLTLADVVENAVAKAMKLRTEDAGMTAGGKLSQLISLIAITLEHRDDGEWDTLGAVQGCLQYAEALFNQVQRDWQ